MNDVIGSGNRTSMIGLCVSHSHKQNKVDTDRQADRHQMTGTDLRVGKGGYSVDRAH